MTFAENLKAQLKKAGMSQTELAVKVGIAEPTVSMYCTGNRVPSLQKLYKIAEVLGCTFDDLMKGE